VLDALSDYEVKARVIFAPAGSDNESIVYSYNGVKSEINAPRQRHREGEGFRLSLADFIKPVSEQGELTDWIALFAVTVGMELQSKIENFKADGDDYNTILYQALADRLAEAATEMMHRSVKRGDIEIRPAIGYPSLPDQSIIFVIDKLLHMHEAGIELTANGAMRPHASVCGIMIAHPAAQYFAVGKIDGEQLADYAKRRGTTAGELTKFLAKNIG
jgi:cobalamin-dependent methionine synthase I